MTSKTKNAPLFNSDKELSDYLLKNVTDSLKQAVKVTVTMMVKEEMEKLRKELDEKLSFNGYYQRNLISTIGKIQDINIPRFRESRNDLNLSSMGIFEEENQHFLKLVAEMHRMGVSQDKVRKIAKNCFGITISKNRVSVVHKELAEQEEFKINNQAIENEFEHLLIDGIWVKCKSFGLKEDNKSVLLCALGITKEGERKIIGFKLAFSEDYENWHEFILSLKERGLKSTESIISDDNGGLTKAIEHLFPKAKHQICIVHKMRNVISKTSYKHKASVTEDLKKIYEADSKEEAKKKYEIFSRNWYVREEKAVNSLRFNFDKTLTYFDFPKDKWKQVRTTNILEREFREVRRRIKVFDNSFQNSASCENYANSIFSYLNEHYPNHLHTKG